MHTKLDERWTHGIEYVNMHLLLQIGVGGDLAKLPNMRIAISTASLQEAGTAVTAALRRSSHCSPIVGRQLARSLLAVLRPQ